MEVFDCNGDEKVSFHEMVVALMLDEEDPSSLQAFEKWDDNGDHFLSEEELRNDPFHLESASCRESLHSHERPSSSNQIPGDFRVYDTNEDGLISKDEFKAVVEKQYPEVSEAKLDNLMQKLSRCDGEIDTDDFNLAVAVSAPWLFSMAEGDEKADQIKVEDEVYEEIKYDRVGDEGRRQARGSCRETV
jgi:Ca2+-binding EF-hand superfamily protein